MALLLELTEELEDSLEVLDVLSTIHEKELREWKVKEANFVKTQVELISKNDALKAQNYELVQSFSLLKAEFSALQTEHVCSADKIAALRSVARALEAENQLLACEKEHLEQFKNQFCRDNGSLKVAVDQIDSLRRQVNTKNEELKFLHKHAEYQEAEKIKIVQKLAQVEHDCDLKTHSLNNLKAQLSDKTDTLEALRLAKRDVEVRLQNNWIDKKALSQKNDQLEALKSELAMQESMMEEMHVNLSKQIDEINLSKEAEIQGIKDTFASLFDEKAQELEQIRQEHENAKAKIESQSRMISDLEFREKELSKMLEKKQDCHHREFDKTYNQMVDEIAMLQRNAKTSEGELKNLRLLFYDLQNFVKSPPPLPSISVENKAVLVEADSSQDCNGVSINEDSRNHTTSKKKRGRRNKR